MLNWKASFNWKGKVYGYKHRVHFNVKSAVNHILMKNIEKYSHKWICSFRFTFTSTSILSCYNFWLIAYVHVYCIVFKLSLTYCLSYIIIVLTGSGQLVYTHTIHLTVIVIFVFTFIVPSTNYTLTTTFYSITKIFSM